MPASTELLTNEPQQSEHQESVDVFSTEDGGRLVYWHTGVFYNAEKLFFIIESMADTVKHQDRDGVLIMCSPTAEGRKVLGQLIDLVEQLISEWYPGLAGELDHKVPCYKCAKSGVPNPFEFRVDTLLPLVAEHRLSTVCVVCNKVLHLINLVPDLLLADLDKAFLLDASEVIYKKEKENLLGIGAFGEVYRGKYKGQSVAVKLYTAKEGNKVEEGFKDLRSESKVLQQLHHPCLVCMVGVTVHPTMSLVLEKAPQGTLQAPLLKEKRYLSRIVMYRIATQVASALHFLHSINIIFRDLKADNVLLWSLSPDHLINCKVTDFNISTHADPGGSLGLHGTKGFIAPEVARVNHLKERSVYDHRADIFSFGMFLYQLIARRHPFHNVSPFKINASIEAGQRPQLEDIPEAETGLFYMTRIMKLCWEGCADKRPKTQAIVEWLCAPALQLIISVIPIGSKYHFWNGCIVTPLLSNQVIPVSSELWICCNGIKGSELRIFNMHTMVKVSTHFMSGNQVLCMKQCGDYIWVASRAGLEYGRINIFSNYTKDLVHSITLTEHTISCITNSEQLVYMGTMEGYCFAFPMDVHAIQHEIKLNCKYVSEYSVDGVVITKTCLWVSSRNCIHFLNPDSIDLEGVEKRTKNTQAFVGLMQLSDNEDQVWSAHLGGVMMSAWNAHQRVHLCDVDVSVIAEEKCHVGDPGGQIITAMCTGLDTVWIGIASGYIIVFGMNPYSNASSCNPPGELLTYFKPYKSFIRFLAAANYPGPCQKEECMMISGGKTYQPDDSFKELPDYVHGNENGEPVDSAGVAILWEVLPAKYVRQVHYLSEGTSYINYSRLEETMIETGFTESMKWCPSNYHSYHEQQFAKKIDLVELLTAVYPSFFLNENDLKSENLFAGTEEAYQGHYKGQPVAIKICTSEDKNKIKEYLKRLHEEGNIIKQLHHPCVAHLFGVITQPMTSLVLKYPHYESFLLNEQRFMQRIVVYRIAIQVASALSFLHDTNIIHLKLSTDNVLLWSISPDCLINCKIIAFNLAGSLRAQSDHFLNDFYLENSYMKFLNQLLILRNYIQLYHVDPMPNTDLFCLLRLHQSCTTIDNYQQIIEWLSAPVQQLIMSIIPIRGIHTVCGGCIVPAFTSRTESVLKPTINVWISGNIARVFELSIFEMGGINNVQLTNVQFSCMQQCGDYIWMAFQSDWDDGVIYVFDIQKKKQIHKIQTFLCIVSCITANSDHFVYIGTEEGYCFVIPMDMNIQAIHNDIWSHDHKCVSEYCIDGVLLTQTTLWVSSCDQIYFLNPNTLEVEGVEKRTKNKHAYVGKMMLCDNGDEVWSAHLGGVIMSSWNAHQRVHLCDVDVGVIAEVKCHVCDPRGQIITAMCTSLDTVWIGLASGHIIVFGMNPPGEVLTYFRPYHSYVRFLSAANYLGPCGKKECMMLSGGKIHHLDDGVIRISEHFQRYKKSHSLATSGVVILWEVLTSKYMRQVHLIRDGTSWKSFPRLEKTMKKAGFTESINDYITMSPDTATDNKAYTTSTYDEVGDQHTRYLQEECVNSLLNSDSTISSEFSKLDSLVEQLLVEIANRHWLQLTCEPPFTLKSVLSKIAVEGQVNGSFLITYQNNSNHMVAIKTPDAFQHYLKLPNRPNLHVQLLT